MGCELPGLARGQRQLCAKHIGVEHNASGVVKSVSGFLPFSGHVGSSACSMKHTLICSRHLTYQRKISAKLQLVEKLTRMDDHWEGLKTLLTDYRGETASN